jgi:hypothetical protein
VLGRGPGSLLRVPGLRCGGSVVRPSPAHLSPAHSSLPGGHRKLIYYFNEGHYGNFRIFLREPVFRTPIVIKVRGLLGSETAKPSPRLPRQVCTQASWCVPLCACVF